MNKPARSLIAFMTKFVGGFLVMFCGLGCFIENPKLGGVGIGAWLIWKANKTLTELKQQP